MTASTETVTVHTILALARQLSAANRRWLVDLLSRTSDAPLPERATLDEAGFTLQPSIPYAWQLVGQRLELASAHGPRQNVLGFFNLHHQFHSFAFKGSIDTRTVIHCFDLFSAYRTKPALVVIDNAPIHTSEDFEDQIERWQKEELYVKFLPPYCPELNLIEILWRKIKYEWLPLDAYQNFNTLTASLFDVIKGIGSKYRITFA